MFFYFPLKKRSGTVVGSVRVENGKAAFTLSQPERADAFLFADGKILPIRPGESIPVGAPEALIGARGGEAVYAGTAPGVRLSAEQMLYRLSQNSTKNTDNSTDYPEAAPVPTEIDDPVSVESGADLPQFERISTPELPKSDDFLLDHMQSILKSLQEMPLPSSEPEQFVPNMVHNVDKSVDNSARISDFMSQKEDDLRSDLPERRAGDPLLWQRDDSRLPRIDLFPNIFPGAQWRFVADDGVMPHYEGTWSHGGERIRILAVRGTYDREPPRGLKGYTRYLRTDGAGYWVRLLPLGRG